MKRTEGDLLRVTADLVADGHDVVAGVLLHRAPGAQRWTEVPMAPRVNDRFSADLPLDRIGRWELAVEGWVDEIASWRRGLERKAEVGEATDLDLAIGAQLLESAAERAEGDERRLLHGAARLLVQKETELDERVRAALSKPLLEVAAAHADRSLATRSEPWPLVVDPPHARFASWYELFPRSTGPDGAHGTFRTAEEWLPYVQEMGFDVLYLPPIHPIGTSFRKGKNNTLSAVTATAEDTDGAGGDPGSPWAIGAPEGGHTAVHPALGTLEDFDRFVRRAGEHGLRIALDIAFQASPDHPWVKEHPEWFRKRPDGTIQYAENPPKKYQDVYPFDFECENWRELWAALRDVFLFWLARGVTIFRVDNPHTKPIAFWDWCISSIKAEHPEATFLSEAFTRPKLKFALAKVGFSEGYTYFTWRNTKHDLTEYLRELTRTEVADYFRPSFWPNTPDILPEDLQFGGRPAFLARLVLAGTLSSHYGIYGPAFELLEHAARPGSGEYLDNEKFELKRWNRDRPDSLRRVIATLNRIRREHPALQYNDTLRFHPTDNDLLLCYSKTCGEDVVIVAVSLDFHHRQSGWVELDLDALGIERGEAFQVHDLLGGGRYLWQSSPGSGSARSFLELDPHAMPAQIFAVRRRVRTEREFDYFM
ncbi:MAG: alpha-1,4-glucan--maltose-1-phosphate maltosyltransferase [Myxococcota bacterium]|nr:alpha-1,4-glucan--maltose-1-phosphate maltosyltransferase [Myxococcota bacterium]